MANHYRALQIDSETMKSLVEDLAKASSFLEELRRKIILSLPVKYGTDLWWEKSDLEAMKKIAKGSGIRFETAEEVIGYLES